MTPGNFTVTWFHCARSYLTPSCAVCGSRFEDGWEALRNGWAVSVRSAWDVGEWRP